MNGVDCGTNPFDSLFQRITWFFRSFFPPFSPIRVSVTNFVLMLARLSQAPLFYLLDTLHRIIATAIARYVYTIKKVYYRRNANERV